MPDIVTVKAGEKMRVDAIVAGKPTPFCKWKQGAEDLLTSDRLMVQKSPNCISLIMKDVSRKDSGYYSLSAKNSAAKISQILRVVVQGKFY